MTTIFNVKYLNNLLYYIYIRFNNSDMFIYNNLCSH